MFIQLEHTKIVTGNNQVGNVQVSILKNIFQVSSNAFRFILLKSGDTEVLDRFSLFSKLAGAP